MALKMSFSLSSNLVDEWPTSTISSIDELTKLIGEHWKSTSMLNYSEGQFVEEAIALLKDGIDVIPDAEKALTNMFSYPLYDTLASAETKPVLEDKLWDVAASLLAAYDAGDVTAALEEGPAGWQKWVKSFSKSIKRKVSSVLYGTSVVGPRRFEVTNRREGLQMKFAF